MKSGYDLSRLIKFTLREDWRDALEDAMAEHVGLAQEEFGVEFEEIGDMVADVLEALRDKGEQGDADVEANVRGRVRALCQRFPIYQG